MISEWGINPAAGNNRSQRSAEQGLKN